MPNTLFAHHIDLDGITPAVLLSISEGLSISKSICFNYDEVTPELISEFSTFSEILMVDISLPVDDFTTLLDKGIKITLLDHHESAYEGDAENKPLKDLVHPNFNYTYTLEKCGTKLFYEYLIANKYLSPTPILDYFVSLVDVYDRWQDKSLLWEEAQNLNRAFFKMQKYYLDGLPRYEEYITDMIKKMGKYEDIEAFDTFPFNNFEKRVIQESIDRENHLTKSCMKHLLVRTDSKLMKFGVISVGAKVSIVAHNILVARSDLDYLVIINTFKPSGYKMQLRSKGFNLLQLEGVHGHTDAAGTDKEKYNHGFCQRFLLRDLSLSYREKRSTRKPRVV